jgi:nucleoside-diphosphate-sugar epimerase
VVKRRALVTGATGGLGQSLVPALLKAGYEVRATGRNAQVGAALEDAGAAFACADLLTADLHSLTRGVDAVFHLAAKSSPWAPDDVFDQINYRVTSSLLDSAARSGCDSFIFASTPSIFAEGRDRIGLRSDDPPAREFLNAYASSKFAAEEAVRAAGQSGLATVILRPRALVGPNDTVLLPRLLRAGRNGYFPLPRKGAALIDITDMDDAALAFLAADTHRERARGRAINISGGAPRPLRDVLALIFRTLGKPVAFIHLNAGLAAALADVMERAAHLLPGSPEPPATRFSIMALTHSLTLDISEARDHLDWTPRVSPEDAIISALTRMKIRA